MNNTALLRQAPVWRQELALDWEECFSGTLVRDPAEMATVLSAASSSRAKSFAVAMHERACFGDDELKRDFWSLVIQHLE